MESKNQFTILDTLITGQRFLTPGGQAITSQGSIKGEPVLYVGYDIGNRATKAALLSPEGKLSTLHVPTAYRPAQEIRAGKGAVTYHVDQGDPFWIGDEALTGGQSLPLGALPSRLDDQRLRWFTAACLAELLHAGGYDPGEYALAVGFAIPNTEIVRKPAEKKGEEKLGVSPATEQALMTHIKGKSYQVTRVDEDGRAVQYDITIQYLLPQAQSVGTHTAYTRTPIGTLITDIQHMRLVDIGGGDLFFTEIWTKPYRMVTERKGDGTIVLARRLMEVHDTLTEIAAQEALRTRKILYGGRWRDIGADVDRVKATHGEVITGKTLEVFRDIETFGLFTGGGSALLNDQLLAKAATIERAKRRETYDIINHDGLATILNAVGSLFGIIFATAR